MAFASAPTSRESPRTTYLGALLTAALMAALVALLIIVLLSRGELSGALTEYSQGRATITKHVWLLVTLIIGPLLCATLAALGMWQAIWTIRVSRYLRSIHAYCLDKLRRDAPLLALGVAPTGRLLDSPEIHATEPQPISNLLAMTPQALLLGAAGAGKTTALLSFAQSHSAGSLATPVGWLFRRQSLPVVLSLPGLARSLSDMEPSAIPYIAELLSRLGTAGLGARAERLLRAGRLILLCDDYDKLDDDEREIINLTLQTLREAPFGACRIVVACESGAYATVVDDLGPLARFSAIELAPIPIGEISNAIEKRQGGARLLVNARRSTTRKLPTDLLERPISASLRTAAIAAALMETLASGEGIAWGRAELLRAYLRLASATATVRDLDISDSPTEEDPAQQPVFVWAALAASLQDTQRGFAPLDPARTVGECIHEWLTNHPPPEPTDFALRPAPEIPLAQIEREAQAGLRIGILQRSLDGLTLSFAHTLTQASAAAWWLDLRDDGLGRLNSQLLRPHWALPVCLWAGAHAESADYAQRIFRFANAPSSISPRIGASDRQDIYPQALALALAAILEGAAPQLSRMIARQETRTHPFILAQQGLRDLLDTCVIYGSDPARRQRLSLALSHAQRNVGIELVAYLGALAREISLDRLLRAQLTTTLGLLATPEAIDELMPLLLQSDPTMRQAVDQALVYAGAHAVPALQSAARGGSATTRHRAAEALRLLTGIAPAAGEAAGGAALAGLSSPDAAQRRVAVTTLSAIGASEALNELIARLDDVNIEVRLAAAQALGQLGGKRALLALRRRADSDDTRLRLAVAQALGRDPTPSSTLTLLRLLKDADASVRAAAAATLGAIGDSRALGPLRQAAEDPDPWVRHAAQTASRRFKRG